MSSRNTCYFCQTSHGAAAAHLNGGDAGLVESVCRDFRTAPISDKLKALLAIAEQVQIDGKRVTKELVRDGAQARSDGCGHSRHGADYCCFLHVQPLRGWFGHLATT